VLLHRWLGEPLAELLDVGWYMEGLDIDDLREVLSLTSSRTLEPHGNTPDGN
jgi:hypothetical protein